ncbi:hypothetical protein GIB67_004531 [Kingdonia uniflora]|uniref:Uncharacterized protein n=1 Tax=Kingdonia uniflora TaxID=39325 RepID=A0A7J7ML27_9MAGN|nr:hypothetical protein GIB67_004531 [Kingdonia uniflora]
MPDRPVDMPTVSTHCTESCEEEGREKGASSRSATSDSMDDSSKRRKFARILRGVQLSLQDRSIELERRISQLEGEKNQFEESLTREREVFQLELEKEREDAALKLKEVRAESQRNYEEKEIVDEEEDEEMEDGLNVAEKTIADNQETIDQEIKTLRLRVVDLEGLLEVEKNSSADLQKELDVAREREEQTLLYNTDYAEEYEALISQYEDRLDDNVKLSIKLKEDKSQVEDKTTVLLSKDLALNQLISELAELKGRAASGSRHDVELPEYVERDLMKDYFFGRTSVCKLEISSIDPIGIMDRGIGTMTAEKIAQGEKLLLNEL